MAHGIGGESIEKGKRGVRGKGEKEEWEIGHGMGEEQGVQRHEAGGKRREGRGEGKRAQRVGEEDRVE